MRTCMPDQDHSLCCWHSKFSLGCPHCHPSPTSFPGWHLSGVQRGENLKVLSWGCRVDVVTLSVHLCDGFQSPDTCEALCFCAEVTFHAASCQAKLVGNASSFFSVCLYTHLSCLSCLYHINENHSFSPRTPWLSCFWLMENIKELHLSYFSVPSLFLSCNLQCSYQLQHFHKRCWVVCGCSAQFLSLQHGTLITARCL